MVTRLDSAGPMLDMIAAKSATADTPHRHGDEVSASSLQLSPGLVSGRL